MSYVRMKLDGLRCLGHVLSRANTILPRRASFSIPVTWRLSLLSYLEGVT